MSTNQHLFWGAVASLPYLSAVQLHLLMNFFSDGEQAFRASVSSLRDAGLESDVASALFNHCTQFNLETFSQLCQKESIQIVTFHDPEYPSLLREITDPPALLFIKGELRDSDFPLAVVGSRKMTAYGERLIESIVGPCAEAGCAIISGLAYGVDGSAHSVALQHNAYTIAVLGTGIDSTSLYPKKHSTLAQKILSSGGAIVSEYAPGTPGLKLHFPMRNRIIAGLSKIIYIAEAAQRSGSLISARLGLEYNRIVCTSPGSIFSKQSEGCNTLIAQGAKPILTSTDLLEEFGISLDQKQSTVSATESQAHDILKHLHEEPLHIDDIAQLLNRSMPDLLATLTILECERKIKQVSPMRYIKM